MSNIKMHSKQI